MDSDKKYWVGFNLVKGIGPTRLRRLLQYFGGVRTAWEAPPESLRAAGLGEKIVHTLLQVRAQVDLDSLWERLRTQGIEVLTWEDERYPPRLKELEHPPPLLYIRGALLGEDRWAVAIVGTRRVTAYGRQVAAELAAHLARNGVTVVSGLARGVDAVAHQAAVEAGGRTLAVLGCGVDRIYPPEHRRLAEEIIAQGALISDYPLGTPPEGVNFPPRNRIIAGLSLATIVVEAGRSSGALITADFALEQGREVFAVPGNILAPQSKGTNWLIQQGARPLLHPQEVLEFLDLTRVVQHRAARKVLPANEEEAQLIQVIGDEPLHVDDICVRTGLPVEKVSATLALMELKGMVRRVGGMQYVALRELRADYGDNEVN